MSKFHRKGILHFKHTCIITIVRPLCKGRLLQWHSQRWTNWQMPVWVVLCSPSEPFQKVRTTTPASPPHCSWRGGATITVYSGACKIYHFAFPSGNTTVFPTPNTRPITIACSAFSFIMHVTQRADTLSPTQTIWIHLLQTCSELQRGWGNNKGS